MDLMTSYGSGNLFHNAAYLDQSIYHMSDVNYGTSIFDILNEDFPPFGDRSPSYGLHDSLDNDDDLQFIDAAISSSNNVFLDTSEDFLNVIGESVTTYDNIGSETDEYMGESIKSDVQAYRNLLNMKDPEIKDCNDDNSVPCNDDNSVPCNDDNSVPTDFSVLEGERPLTFEHIFQNLMSWSSFLDQESYNDILSNVKLEDEIIAWADGNPNIRDGDPALEEFFSQANFDLPKSTIPAAIDLVKSIYNDHSYSKPPYDISIQQEPPVTIKEEVVEESETSDSSEEEEKVSDVIRTVNHNKVDNQSNSKDDKLFTLKSQRPIRRQTRSSQRENTPPVRYRGLSKREAAKAVTVVLNQMGQNSKNTKTTQSKRGRKRTSSALSSPSISHANSDVDEPVMKRSMHNDMERMRRDDQRVALHHLRDKIPELKGNTKASKVKIITEAQSFIQLLISKDERLSKEIAYQEDMNLYLTKKKKTLCREIEMFRR